MPIMASGSNESIMFFSPCSWSRSSSWTDSPGIEIDADTNWDYVLQVLLPVMLSTAVSRTSLTCCVAGSVCCVVVDWAAANAFKTLFVIASTSAESIVAAAGCVMEDVAATCALAEDSCTSADVMVAAGRFTFLTAAAMPSDAWRLGGILKHYPMSMTSCIHQKGGKPYRDVWLSLVGVSSSCFNFVIDCSSVYSFIVLKVWLIYTCNRVHCVCPGPWPFNLFFPVVLSLFWLGGNFII